MKFKKDDRAVIRGTEIEVSIIEYNKFKRQYLVTAVDITNEIDAYYSSRNLIEVPGPCRHRTLCYLIEQVVEHCITNPTARERLLLELREAKDMT